MKEKAKNRSHPSPLRLFLGRGAGTSGLAALLLVLVARLLSGPADRAPPHAFPPIDDAGKRPAPRACLSNQVPPLRRAARAPASDGATPGPAGLPALRQGPNHPLSLLLAGASVLAAAEHAHDSGIIERRRLVRTTFKYPLVRVVEIFRPANAPGRAALVARTVMVADHILVRLRPGATETELHRLNRRHGARIRRQLRAPRTYLVALPHPGLNTVPAAVAAYTRETGLVRFAEPDYIVYAATAPDDTHYGELWGLHNTGQTGGTTDADVDAPEAWDYLTGTRSVLVGVIDTGIDYNHEDLAGNIWSNAAEIAGNGLDDDGNGYIDDTRGWDFVNEDNNPMDDHWHGTHCSGVLGAVGNNGLGVVGMAWRVRLIPLKFLNSGGTGATSDAVDAVYYATRKRVRLTNNSWAGDSYSAAMEAALDDAAASNILFVAAADNHGADNDVAPNYPSSYPNANVLAVAATDDDDALASFSNYGATRVDLAAPGNAILSCKLGGGYQLRNGTSMATAYVSGLCALLATLDPAASYAEIRDAVLDNADPVPALSGKCVTGARMNARTALESFGARLSDVAILAGRDDAEQGPGGNVTLASTDLELVTEVSNEQLVGLRFAGVPVPRNARILNAHIQFKVDETNNAPAHLQIRAALVDDAAPFAGAASNLSDRARSDLIVVWQPPAWPTLGAAGMAQRTPELGRLLQRIVDRPGWRPGNALALLIGGTGTRTAESYDGDPAGAPRLHVAYRVAGPDGPVWTAYNDLAWYSGQTRTNITTYTKGQAGTLTNYLTGAGLAATLAVAGGSPYNSGADAQTNTDAHAVFGGIVDSAGVIGYSPTNLTLTVSGLDPALRYELVLFGNRDVAGYTGRYTTFTLAGASNFVNASTAGALYAGPADPTTIVTNGWNRTDGFVARYRRIAPGTDGAFTVTAGNEPSKFYANALMLSARTEPGPANRPPTIDPISNVVVEAGTPISFAIGAADPDTNDVALSLDGLFAVRRVLDLNPGSGGGGAGGLTVYGDALHFGANDMPHANDTELWAYDGEAARLAAELCPGTTGSSPSDLTVYADRLYFSARESGSGPLRLRQYDGTNATLAPDPTAENVGVPNQLIVYDGALYFQGSRSDVGTELWTFDGTNQTLIDLYDNGSPANNGSSLPQHFVVHDGALYFSAATVTNDGSELTRYTETGGAVRVANIRTDGGSAPASLASFNGTLYFAANDGVHGNELWCYDGTNAWMLADIRPGGQYDSGNPSGMTVYAGALYFAANDGSTNGVELWRCDGKIVERVANINPNPPGGGGDAFLADSNPGNFFVYANTLLFSADDGTNGVELWRYDTKSGCALAADIRAGQFGSQPSGFTPYGNALYFYADDGYSGGELFRLQLVTNSGASLTATNGLFEWTPTEPNRYVAGVRAQDNGVPALDETAWFTILCGPAKEQSPILRNAVWHYAKGSTEASDPATAWRMTDFDDSAWATGALPIGYRDAGWTNGTELSDMKGFYTSVMLRKPFTLDAPGLLSELILQVDYDDGFIAWLNGTELARVNVSNAPGSFVPHDAVAAANGNGTWSNTFTGATLPGLDTGTNLLAIQVFNRSLAESGDCLLNAALSVVGSPFDTATDADLDGLPDDWETDAYGAAAAWDWRDDPDGDGYANIDEFVLGSAISTNPTCFGVALDRTGQVLTVSTPSIVAGGAGYDTLTRYYAFEQRLELGDGQVWTNVPGYARKAATGSSIVYTNATPAGPLFYRARVWLE